MPTFQVIVYEEHTFSFRLDAANSEEARKLASKRDLEDVEPDTVCTTDIIVELLQEQAVPDEE